MAIAHPDLEVQIAAPVGMGRQPPGSIVVIYQGCIAAAVAHASHR